MATAASLCLAAIGVDYHLRFDWEDAEHVAQIEVVLAVYGGTCAVVCLSRGALTTGDKQGIVACLCLFILTAYAGAIMPRAIHC
jgi:hypothetical protein